MPWTISVSPTAEVTPLLPLPKAALPLGSARGRLGAGTKSRNKPHRVMLVVRKIYCHRNDPDAGC
jgi:hypothetical protein